MSSYRDNRNGQIRPVPNCARLGLHWSPKTQRCEQRGGLGYLDFDDWVFNSGNYFDPDNSAAPFSAPYDQDASGDYYSNDSWFDAAPLGGDGVESYGDDGSYYYEDPLGAWFYQDGSGAYYGGDPYGNSYGSYDGADYWETDTNGNYYWGAPNGESYFEDSAGNWTWNDAAGNTCSGDAAGGFYCADDWRYSQQAINTQQIARQTRQAVSATSYRPQTTAQTRQVSQPSQTPIYSQNMLGSQSQSISPWLLLGAGALLVLVATR